MSTSTTWATAWPEDVLARYLTVGGAHVDLLRHKFRTRYTPQGRPFVSDQWREVDGFIWQCRGCDTRGGVGVFDDQYLPNERKQANEDANSHAAACRSMARPVH
ncbi:hypothetical protein PUR71_09080 [Streptomyces sp. SP17BM10]|uniref:hypothetical protein n=1 Tax=Streptomyces sp. SP17BM10 TaxID=3002530 RepID=UPI002E79AD8B|nr:hypothetical protein [Streptomyces sp. SP17BM10]MEE1783068.1 hypothetical protein [Streptomyces sp. SP17BM10]